MSLSIEVRWDKKVIEKLKKLGEKDLVAAREKWLNEAFSYMTGNIIFSNAMSAQIFK